MSSQASSFSPSPVPAADLPTMAGYAPSSHHPSEKQLQQAASALFADFATPGLPCQALLTHFSTTHLVVLDHSPAQPPSSPSSSASPPQPPTPPLIGLNAVRSYFDLLSMHYTRLKMTTHSTRALPELARIVATASIQWRWNASGKEWIEDVECTLDFDEHLKVKSFVVKTQGPADTCVMRAVDHSHERTHEDRTPHVFSA